MLCIRHCGLVVLLSQWVFTIIVFQFISISLICIFERLPFHRAARFSARVYRDVCGSVKKEAAAADDNLALTALTTLPTSVNGNS